MYWLISGFPELGTLELKERGEVLRRVPWWTYPVMGARAVLPAGAIGFWAFVVGDDVVGLGERAAWLLGAAVVVASAVGLWQLQLRLLRTEVRREIARRFLGGRPPFCFACGYDLRGTAGGCPECGWGR